MAEQYTAQPGQLPRVFQQLRLPAKGAGRCFVSRRRQVPVWEQSRGMDEAAREQFLARFTADSQGIGFAVLGGSFAEGIDLPGRRPHRRLHRHTGPAAVQPPSTST